MIQYNNYIINATFVNDFYLLLILCQSVNNLTIVDVAVCGDIVKF